MPSITLHPKPSSPQYHAQPNPLPQLLQTPSGLAILELQGTFHLPQQISNQPQDEPNDDGTATNSAKATTIGRLVFPLYDASKGDTDTSWMKRVHLYVGKHQRMTGEVKKLGKPLAVIRKREVASGEAEGGAESDELEIVEIVRFKVLFAHRPEPVGASGEAV
ncbi:chromosome transmission fidelity protein 8 [Delphinella strobiligena]|nr:chromosome transmission fidelity protein 8 [Delphinella strobiligena]